MIFNDFGVILSDFGVILSDFWGDFGGCSL